MKRNEVAHRVADQMNYLLMDRRAALMQWFDRLYVHGPVIRGVLEEEKVPGDLIYLAVLLSELLPNSRTRAGGVGWWALASPKDKKGASASPWVVTNDWDDRRDPVISTKLASTLLQGPLRKNARMDWLLAVCAFVDGADKVDAVAEKASGFSYWDMVLPSYSESIVPRLIALKIISEHRAFYGVDVPASAPQAFDGLDRVKLAKDLPLHLAAKWCGTNARNMWELNPGVDPSTGILPKADKRMPSGLPLRVPRGTGSKVRQLLQKEGYLAS